MSGSYVQPKTKAFKASGAIVANSFVKLLTTGTADDVVTQCGAGDRPIGVSQNAIADGAVGEIDMIGGGSKVKVSATVTRGQALKSDASGYGTPATADNDKCGCIAMAAAVANDVIPVLVHVLLAGAAE